MPLDFTDDKELEKKDNCLFFTYEDLDKKPCRCVSCGNEPKPIVMRLLSDISNIDRNRFFKGIIKNLHVEIKPVLVYKSEIDNKLTTMTQMIARYRSEKHCVEYREITFRRKFLLLPLGEPIYTLYTDHHHNMEQILEELKTRVVVICRNGECYHKILD